ncbi:MAG: tripartite tricarboxylate transporter substrate binding protein [Synergistaceae bacterium]|jgi:tripartite-type tricarboxylate transporter receptor subunit TctC|nr:tripartite tricarboxylate transporter substrate binding protein [Synergistaceae bacterium]
MKKYAFYVVLMLILTAMTAGVALAAAPKYPERDITIIGPWSPGSGTDTIGRVVAQYASEKWGVPVNVINKVGAYGISGVQELAEAKPDGYTLGTSCQADAQVMYAIFGDNLPFTKDQRTYIVKLSELRFIAAVSVEQNIKTFEELMEFARTDPSFRWSGGSVTGLTGFAIAYLLNEAGVKDINAKRVNFEGGGMDATAAMAGGHLTTYFISETEYKTYCAGDKPLLRPLAVVGDQRLKTAPDLPTTKELGYQCTLKGWYGITGPANIPDYVYTAWEKLVEEGREELEKRYQKAGITFTYLPHKEFTAEGDKMYNDVVKLISELGLEFDVD